MTIVIIVIAALLVLHVAGGARTHRRHYRQHGLHPNLYYTYGRDWHGSIRLHAAIAQRVLYTFIGLGIGVGVTLLADRIQNHAPKTAPAASRA